MQEARVTAHSSVLTAHPHSRSRVRPSERLRSQHHSHASTSRVFRETADVWDLSSRARSLHVDVPSVVAVATVAEVVGTAAYVVANMMLM